MRFELNPALSKTSVLGSTVMAVCLMMLLVLTTVSQAVSGVFASYNDRVVLAQFQGEPVSAETVELLSSSPGVELVGWANETRQERRDAGPLVSGTGYLVYQATESFLTILFPEAQRANPCVLCGEGIAIGGGVVVESQIALGDAVPIGYESKAVASTLGSAVRAPQLNDGIYEAISPLGELKADRHVAILFNRVATATDIDFVASAISPESPSSVTVLATQLEDLKSSSVAGLLSQSSEIVSIGGLALISVLMFVSSSNDIYGRRALVCSYQSIGAGPRVLAGAVIKRSLVVWLVSALVAVGVVSWLQGILVGLTEIGLVPLGLIDTGLVVLLAGVSLCLGGLEGLRRVLAQDPADVMRSLE